MCQIVIKPNGMRISAGDEVLTALALGSSISICLYDGKNRIGGMAHAILPEENGWPGKQQTAVPDKRESGIHSVGEAIEALYEGMLEHGAEAGGITGKLAGGARIFSFLSEKQPDIGRLNVEQARQKLQELGIPVLAEDTGENYGRTVYFYLRDGSLEIETANRFRYII